jgi:hypothetical protein
MFALAAVSAHATARDCLLAYAWSTENRSDRRETLPLGQSADSDCLIARQRLPGFVASTTCAPVRNRQCCTRRHDGQLLATKPNTLAYSDPDGDYHADTPPLCLLALSYSHYTRRCAGTPLCAGSLMAGYILTGLDHVLMIVAVSAWALLMGVAASWSRPASACSWDSAHCCRGQRHGRRDCNRLTVMGAGTGHGSSTSLTAALTAVFAIVHGFAHGTEAPGGAGFAYIASCSPQVC